MKLHLHGTREEVAEATCQLVQVLEVVSVRPPYPDRGASVLVRVYLEVHLDAANPTRPTGTLLGSSRDHCRSAGTRGQRRWSG
jgi:hypothetical protein